VLWEHRISNKLYHEVSSEREVSKWKSRRGGPVNDGLTEKKKKKKKKKGERKSNGLLTSGLYPDN
jgi:hypothetical protein